MSDARRSLPCMHPVEEVRSRPFDAAMNGALPAMIDVRTPAGVTRVGVSRDDAAEHLGSTLFSGGITTISVSAWTRGGEKRRPDYAEVLATLHQVFGPSTLPKLRRVILGGGAIYFVGLTHGTEFVSPTPLQDAVLAKQCDAVPALS